MDDESPIPSEPILSEEETLKQLQDDFTKGYRQKITELQLRADKAEKLVCELREALTKAQSSIIAHHSYLVMERSHAACPICDKTDFGLQTIATALSKIPYSISSKWIERGVVEKCEAVMAFIADERPEADQLLEALTLARQHLDKSK